MKVCLGNKEIYTNLTSDTVHEDLVNDMWSEYLKDVEDYDTRVTDAWKDDANGVLVFVSPNLQVLVVHHNDNLGDWSFLRNCRILYHRKLPNVVLGFW